MWDRCVFIYHKLWHGWGWGRLPSDWRWNRNRFLVSHCAMCRWLVDEKPTRPGSWSPFFSHTMSVTLAQTLEFPRTYFPRVDGHRKLSFSCTWLCLPWPKVTEDSMVLYKQREQSFWKHWALWGAFELGQIHHDNTLCWCKLKVQTHTWDTKLNSTIWVTLVSISTAPMSRKKREEQTQQRNNQKASGLPVSSVFSTSPEKSVSAPWWSPSQSADQVLLGTHTCVSTGLFYQKGVCLCVCVCSVYLSQI